MTQLTKEEIYQLGHAFFDGKTLQFYAEDQWCDWITKDSITFGMYANWRIKPDEPKTITICTFTHEDGTVRDAVKGSEQYKVYVSSSAWTHIKSLNKVGGGGVMTIDKDKIRAAAMAALDANLENGLGLKEIQELRHKHLSESNPSTVLSLLDALDKAEKQLADANEQADIHRQWNLGYMKSNDDHRTALLASLARESRLREALFDVNRMLFGDQIGFDHELFYAAISIQHDDTALKEYLAKAKQEEKHNV